MLRHRCATKAVFRRIRSLLADLNDNDDKGVLAHGGFGSLAKVDGGLSA